MADWTSSKWFDYKIDRTRNTQLDLSNIYNSNKIYTDNVRLTTVGLTSISGTVENPTVTISVNGTETTIATNKNFYENSSRFVDVFIPLPVSNGILNLELKNCDSRLVFAKGNNKCALINYNYKYPYQYPKSLNVIGRNLAEPITIEIDNAGYGISAWGLVGAKNYTNRVDMIPKIENINRNNVTIYALYYNIEPWDDIENGTTGWYSSDSVPQVIINDFYSQGAVIGALDVNNTSIQNQTLVTWYSQNQQHFWIEIWKNNTLIYNHNEETSRNNYLLPNNIFTQIGDYTIKVKAKKQNNILESEWATKTVNFTINQPSVTNLLQIGEYWEEDIAINCRAENCTSFEWELYQNNNKIGNTITTTQPKAIIQANTFAQKDNCSVRVRGINNYQGIIAYSNWQEISLRLQDVQPTLSNLALSGSNIDLKLVFSWVATDQQKFEAEIKRDEELIKNYNGTTTNLVEIPPGTLTVGLYKFRVRVAYKDRWTAWQEITVTLVETLPSIGLLEPDGIIVERDDNIRVWWISTNQTKWALKLKDDSGSIKTYTGTTVKENILPPGILVNGPCSMELTVYYITQTGIEKKVVKEAEFIVHGKPPIPTITSGNNFTTSRPLAEWDSQDQQGYILDILDAKNNIVYSTDWENGLVTQHKVLDYLPIGAYTLRIKVVNQYSLESDYGIQQITINAVEATTITLNAIALESSVMLNWNNINNKFTKFYILRNGITITKTNDTKYIDHTAWGECTYTIRGITAQDVYKDSNRAYAECNIRHGIMATVNSMDDIIEVGLSRDEFNFSGSIGLEGTEVILSGRELPVVIFGEHRKGVYNINFVRDDLFRFIDMCKRRQTFLYRDNRQKLYLTINSPSYKIDHFGLEYSIQATEVDYKEGIEYD
ncbi:MAG: hypothetical protein AB9856_14485 [Cellulosilyticaceae bacterium]